MADLALRLRRVKGMPGVLVVSLGGSIDPWNLKQLREALTAATAKGFRFAVLDLERVRYINSGGLSYLVNLSDELATQGGALHLANPQPKVKVVFDLMGVSDYFKLHSTVASAVQKLSARRPAAPPVPKRLNARS